MMRLTSAGMAVQAALALAIALVGASVVRTVTSELNDTVARTWPFSMTRCASLVTPGCRAMPVRSATGQAAHIRTGRL